MEGNKKRCRPCEGDEEHKAPKKRKTAPSMVVDDGVQQNSEFAYSAPSVGHIKAKQKRQQLHGELKKISKMEKRKRRERRKKEQEKLGENAPPPPPQRTLDNTREADDTFVQPDDEELKNDTAVDEFAEFFLNKGTPKILITTSPFRNKRGKETMAFVEDLVKMFPNMTFRERRNYPLKDIVEYCKAENYTDIMVVNEDAKQPNSLLLCHLPDGPTALFKLTSIIPSQNIHNHAAPTDHFPEIILNRFSTRLGHSIGRMFAALVPAQPEFVGRRVMTFHNQRDFVFFRQHRYIFDNPEKARLQEIGPRFTLKLKYLQHGTFDSKFGEYEWLPKKELMTSRRRFFL